jgi:peptide/nickel transport system substrate-binding protein
METMPIPPIPPTRRTSHLRRSRPALVVATLIIAALLLAACGGATDSDSTSTNTSSSKTLRTAFFADSQEPDPDVFYSGEGLQITTSAYEGLVKYTTGPSFKILPSLATKWTVSPDGKTYTFTLRDGVKFFDGTPLDSIAVKKSFERRTKVNQGPAYMLASVAGYETPDPQTIVIKLSAPTSAFLDYLAAPYGPKVVSPTAIAAHTKGDDQAQGWLKTHTAGSGPYQLSEWTLGQQYVLQRNDKWWGPKPYYEKLVMKIMPDASSQQIALEGGDLDFIHSQPPTAVDRFENKSGFRVESFPNVLKEWIEVNPTHGPFQNAKLRQALRQAVDKKQILADLFRGRGTLSKSYYPAGMLDDPRAADDPKYDPSVLKAEVAKLPDSDRSVTISTTSENVTDSNVADNIATVLRTAGLKPTVKPVPLSTAFTFVDLPSDQQPELYVGSLNPDAGHPDTWIRIYSRTDGFLNWVSGGTKTADTLMDEGLAATDAQTVTNKYSEAGEDLIKSGTYTGIVDETDDFIVRDSITGFKHQRAVILTVDLAGLKPKS